MQELLKNKKVWVILGLFIVLIAILLFALQQCSRDGAEETKPVKVAQDFKRDYATWSDLKLNGDICKASYLTDLRKVEANFSAVYAKAKKLSVWDGLSDQDRKIYTAYGEVGSELKVMNDAIEARDYKKAQQVLKGILEIEKNVKKENSI